MYQGLLAYQNLKMTPLFVSLLTFNALSTPCSSQGQLQNVLGKYGTTSVYLCNMHTAGRLKAIICHGVWLLFQ